MNFQKQNLLFGLQLHWLKIHTNNDEAQRANEFSEWVKTVWDTKDDNIFLWDFRDLQVEGGLFFKNDMLKVNDSHPNKEFSEIVAPYFCKRIVNVIEGKGIILV